MELTDNWTPAVLSGGTLRPSRSISAMNLRNVERPQSNMSDSIGVVKGSLQRYQRSLKLLGVTDNGQNNDGPIIRPHTRSVKPKVNTRLIRRTVSTEDLKNALINSEPHSDDAPSRGLLSRAVYEAWYFTKAEQCRALDEAKKDRDKITKWREEAERQERLRRGQISYEDWLKKKKELQAKTKEEDQVQQKVVGRSVRGLGARRVVSREAAEAAFEKWKKEKEAAEGKRIRIRSNSEERKKFEEEKKKEEAEKAFEAWRARREEDIKKKREQILREKMCKEESERRQKEAKEKEAESCFRAWALAKEENEAKRKAVSSNVAPQAAIKERQLKERRYEAQQAFASWLDGVLEREAASAEAA